MCRLLGVGKQAYYKHVDKLMLKLAHELIVSDITYVPFWTSREREEYDFCHLSLVTDYYTEEIVGYSVGDTLETRYPLEAQEMRLRHYGGERSVRADPPFRSWCTICQLRIHSPFEGP